MCQQDQLKSAKETRGVASVNPGDSNVLGHNGARADNDMITNGNGEDGSVCPDAHKVAKPCFAPEIPFLCRAAIEETIINEHRPVRDEAIVPDGDQLTDEGVRLNTTALTYFRARLDLDKRPDETVISNCATIEIDWLDDDDVLTKLNVDNPSVPNLRPLQRRLPHSPMLAGSLTQRCLLSLPDCAKALTWTNNCNQANSPARNFAGVVHPLAKSAL
jgi:hypothetical protein